MDMREAIALDEFKRCNPQALPVKLTCQGCHVSTFASKGSPADLEGQGYQCNRCQLIDEVDDAFIDATMNIGNFTVRRAAIAKIVRTILAFEQLNA